MSFQCLQIFRPDNETALPYQGGNLVLPLTKGYRVYISQRVYLKRAMTGNPIEIYASRRHRSVFGDKRLEKRG